MRDLEKVLKEMQTRRYSESTITTYMSCLNRFFDSYSDKNLEKITEQEIKDYMFKLVESNYSRSTQNQHINAIKFYYEQILGQERKTYYVKRPRKDRKLPEILSKEEVQGILNHLPNLKHKAIISTIYSVGLRISEAINLKITDIDSKRMIIKIHQGKGAKDRRVPLNNNLLKLLRNYYGQYRPREYLFNGQGKLQYSGTSIRNVLNRAAKQAGIKKNIHPHTLRHSYATHLLESGIDLRYIQELLGHDSVGTTEIYTHISNKKLGDLKNPFDDMDV